MHMTPRAMNTTQREHLTIALAAMVLIVRAGQAPAATESQPTSRADAACEYFTIQVTDRQTGRGVPLVELRTTNSMRCWTDSNGIVAFHEPGLMNRDVFFFVESHGYSFPKDGFGFNGVRLKTTPGASATIQIDRLNIAERLYRVTGEGIYRDSILTGWPVPLQNPVLNGQVMGQDSVDTCIYHGRLFWLWGDTGRPSYPLGHFAMAGATSDLPGHGGLDPAIGVNLDYFVDKDGFSRPMCPLKEPGLVWLDGLLTVPDKEGRERMVAKYARLKSLDEILERGLAAFNDATRVFEPVIRGDPNFLPCPDFGHAMPVNIDGRPCYYFAIPFPLTVRMRVEARWDDVTDPNRYEVLTALQPDSARENAPYRWVRFGDLTARNASTKARIAGALKREKENVCLYDVESGKKVTPHGGSVYFNAYRHKWVMIFVQQWGESSFLGEVWYAEADTPVGPWAYARKIATHNKYSYYNPKHHPYFDQAGGRVIFFEGTYSYGFSGSEETATPRYDYNQILYRLNLDDPRLVLPTAVYRVRKGQNDEDYLLRGALAEAGRWDSVESVAFYAIEPNRTADGLTAVYVQKVPAGSHRTVRLTTEPPEPSAKPLFLALPAVGEQNKNARIVLLYEYRHAGSGQYLYCTELQLQKEGWKREEKPLCRVWRAPPGPLLFDAKAQPAQIH